MRLVRDDQMGMTLDDFQKQMMTEMRLLVISMTMTLLGTGHYSCRFLYYLMEPGEIQLKWVV